MTQTQNKGTTYKKEQNPSVRRKQPVLNGGTLTMLYEKGVFYKRILLFEQSEDGKEVKVKIRQ